ncbi:Protein Iojap/ribosomal silencing factor RsfS [Ostreococcus tauri]|uniref:Protein Iojap/ribosomal silencing factor RsfS n=1 Tax=Ostreococcus tauri TaxID=70448 RepID=A0A090M6D0_OSTTA|nr:Protein Iojap/ribosomal silencing factor RsfS [Ostreococcus tauri]CEF99751.1 Protein Iojap/ribosomal silencing factor RsfS [Ostreococcus tauri]|eukprot:XP_003082154.2 Protein Iojap/ribosomal silencing factor RsfS [Ostreococcus tauri]
MARVAIGLGRRARCVSMGVDVCVDAGVGARASTSTRGVDHGAWSRAWSTTQTRGNSRASSAGGITRAGSRERGRDNQDRERSFRSRRSVEATNEVEWDGKTFSGSRLEYAGVEVRGELKWPIPLNALAEINPELKELLNYAKTSDGEAEREMADRMSVFGASNARASAKRDAKQRKLGVISTSSSGVRGTNAISKVPGLVEFEQFLFESAWRTDAERMANAHEVRTILEAEAKIKTPIKIKTEDAPMSKTMLGKVKVSALKEAVRTLDIGHLMEGVTKKPDIISYLLAYYEYMNGAVETRTKGFRVSEVSSISAEIIRDAEKGTRAASKDTQKTQIEYEDDPSRMPYAKAFKPDELVHLLVRARGIDVMAINVRDQCAWTDHLIIATARSAQHLKALAGAVLHAVKARTEYVAGGQLQPIIEGAENGGDRDWMAVDCGSCMVHVFSPEGRERYNLEELWADGTEIVHNAPEKLTLANIGSEDATHHTA